MGISLSEWISFLKKPRTILREGFGTLDYTGLCNLSPLELTSDACLNIERSVLGLPFTIMRQLKVESTYYFRSDLLDLGHGNL